MVTDSVRRHAGARGNPGAAVASSAERRVSNVEPEIELCQVSTIRSSEYHVLYN